MVGAAVAADEVRGAGAHAVALRAVLERGDDARGIRQSEIIVTAERKQRLVPDAHPRAPRGRQDQPLAVKPRGAPLVKQALRRLHGSPSLALYTVMRNMVIKIGSSG